MGVPPNIERIGEDITSVAAGNVYRRPLMKFKILEHKAWITF